MPELIPSSSSGNNNNIDAVTASRHWSTSSLTFSFSDSSADYPTSYALHPNYSWLDISGWDIPTSALPFPVDYKMAVRAIFEDQFSAVSGLSVTEVPADSHSDIQLGIAKEDAPFSGFAAVFGNQLNNIDVWYSDDMLTWAPNGPQPGEASWYLLVHELGHAVGLTHGHEGTGSVGGLTLDPAYDSKEYNLLTYRSYPGGPIHDFLTWGNYPQSLMMFDIAALQHLYGPNFSTNSADNIYTFSATTGEMSIDGIGLGPPVENVIFRTIWDGGGNDWYDFSNYASQLNINLTPGEYSSLGMQLSVLSEAEGIVARGNIFNALQYQGDERSLIENARGESGDDTIIGNSQIIFSKARQGMTL